MDEKLKEVGPYRAMLHRMAIVITDDDQLRTFTHDPDEKMDNSNGDKNVVQNKSLNEYVRDGANGCCEILTFFHDHFFGGKKRSLDLTSPDFIAATKAIAKAAAKEGMGIGASVANPLDLGRNFRTAVGVGGQHRNFTEAVPAPDGSFEFDAYMADVWCNNKGPVQLVFNRARLYAYDEIKAKDSPYIEIPFDSIREITDFTAQPSDEPYADSAYFGDRHMHIKGNSGGPCSRIFAVLYMDTPEMDYFHADVKKYAHDVIDMYAREGVHFSELYSDEMHIQFDWDFKHFGTHEIPTRYMTKNFERFLTGFDPLFADFDKLLIYMAYDTAADRGNYGQAHTQHVLGTTPDSLYRTFYLRKLYFEKLQDRVVDICVDARNYVAALGGQIPLCPGHATWQESPTCDEFHPAGLFQLGTAAGGCNYDYTPDYVYSSTIREAISACYDYFKWNDYFTGGGDDYCECGHFDRCYYGGAMAASFAALNDLETAYWGAWGFPGEVGRRFEAVSIAYGTQRSPRWSIVNHGRTRSVDVAIVYPKDLTSCEERFGSWMVQYGYCNYITEDKLLTLGKIENGRLHAGLGAYTTIVVAFQPFYRPEFLTLLCKFAESGGRVIWMSAPPCDSSGRVAPQWQALFGAKTNAGILEGEPAGKVEFHGSLAAVPEMRVLTDMLPDRIYPVTPDGCEDVAKANGKTIGTRKPCGKGEVLFFGCRLRDDQSGESGQDVAALFDVLKAIGAYGGDDNTETISRKSNFFAARFDNGTTAVSIHYRSMKENWDSGFSRNQEKDAEFLKTYDRMVLLNLSFKDLAVNGHVASYEGQSVVQFRTDKSGLIGFLGFGSTGIRLDGMDYRFTKEPADTVFGYIDPARLPDKRHGGFELFTTAEKIKLPFELPQNAVCRLNVSEDGRHMQPADDIKREGSQIILGEKYKGRPLIWLW